MNEDDGSLFADLKEGRRRFLALVAELRPDLHRYCARMTGSVADGEDVVQDTLARAYYALSEMENPPPLRPWLFRIAHTRALDHLRRYDRRMGQPLDTVAEPPSADAVDAEDALAEGEVVRAAISRFVALPPLQRSAVVLKDVLGHSLDEICTLLELSLPAVKAALHRGRTALRATQEDPEETPPEEPSPAVLRYASLFNARDWDGVRAMLAEDVRLDLVSRVQRAGARDVGTYFTNYDKVYDWYLVPARLEGREVLAVFHVPSDPHPAYFVELTWTGDRIAAIRDFRYVPYIAREAVFELSRL
jgi:RNA polymerase sigma factor (sigma-70 family)